MRVKTLFAAILAVAVMAALPAARAQNAAGGAASGNIENGKRLWVKDNCYSCHG